jgi:hypothetical protein
MADRTISVGRLIRLLEEKRVDTAMKLAEAGVDLKEYLIGVGKFREQRALIQYLQNLIEKAPAEPARSLRADNEPEDLDSDEDEDEDFDEPPVRARHSKPRAWGG